MLLAPVLQPPLQRIMKLPLLCSLLCSLLHPPPLIMLLSPLHWLRWQQQEQLAGRLVQQRQLSRHVLPFLVFSAKSLSTR
jgi:hypothetical protein